MRESSSLDAAVARLTAAGLSAERVQTLAGSSLTPKAIDVLAQLE